MSEELCIHELDPRTCSICLKKTGDLGPVTECRSCSALIVWCITANGKRMPVDADPIPDGKIIRAGSVDGVPRVHYLKRNESAGLHQRYSSHFSTCPEADSWRRN